MKNAVHQYEDKLLEFAYGELPQHEADAVDAHVRGCARCSQALTEIRSVRSAMSTLPVEAAPDAGLDSLMAFAEQAAKRNAQTAAPVPFWKKYLTPLVAVMTVVAVGVFGFRASEEFDTSPAAAAADATLAARNEKPRAKRDETAMKSAEAPSPEPVAAAQPVVEEQEKEGWRADDSIGGSSAKLGIQGKGAVRKEMPTQRPTSETRRAVSNFYDGQAEADLKQQNYSDTGARGSKMARAEEKVSPPPPAKAAADKGSAFGLSGPMNTAPSTPSPAPKAEVARADVNKDAPSAAPQVGDGFGGLNTASSGSIGKKKSLSLGNARGGAMVEDESALETADARLSVDRDAQFEERKRSAARTKSLESARVASNNGDRTSEIRYAAEALSGGATGSERVEALKRLCDAWEALGEPSRADPYCDALLREFPGSLAAKNVADRRNSVQRQPARTKKAGDSYEFDDEKKPTPAKPTEAPAQAY